MIRASGALVALSLLACLAGAQDLVFTPAADAAVREDQQDANLATGDLLVQRDDYSAGSRWKRAFLRFDVGGLGTSTPAALTLELFEGDGSAGDAHFEVRAVDPGWSETGLTWRKQPATAGRRLGVYSGPKLGEGQLVRIPLDPAWIRVDGSYGLVPV